MKFLHKTIDLLTAFFLAVKPFMKTAGIFLFYWVCIVPGAYILKVLKHDPMTGTFDSFLTTYWKKRDPAGLESPMKHPF